MKPAPVDHKAVLSAIPTRYNRGEVPVAGADRQTYAALLQLAVNELLENVSDAQAALIAKALFAAHQLGSLELD